MRTSTNLKFLIPELDDQASVTVLGDAFDALDGFAGSALPSNGDGSNLIIAATAATKRENVTTGETLTTIIGKIMKWFSDLGEAAFQGVANNLTTTKAGYVLDARVGASLTKSIEAIEADTFLSEHGLAAQTTSITAGDTKTTIVTKSDVATVTTTIVSGTTTTITDVIVPTTGSYKYTKTTTIVSGTTTTITESYVKEAK